ncbi:Obp8 [Eciton burchellii]|nr:Obp8 [Eciton burchellii]
MSELALARRSSLLKTSKKMMRRTFIFCLFISTALCLYDDVAERIADLLSMSVTEVQTCVNKTNVRVEDAMRMDELINDNIETTEISNSALKIGCLFACLLQKKGLMSGAHLEVDKIKELIESKTRPQAPSEHKIIRDRILNTCNERVRGKVNECEVINKFILCIMAETKKVEEDF